MAREAESMTEELPEAVSAKLEELPSQPTAGNYRVGERLKAVVFTEDGSRCLAYCALDGKMPFTEAEANARAFASLPQLREAANALLDAHLALTGEELAGANVLSSELGRLAGALAQVEGRTL